MNAVPASLLGREREWLEFDDVLSRQEAAVVAVAARPRMGRSTFLEAVRARAIEAGLAVVPAEPGQDLSVMGDTTVPGFIQEVASWPRSDAVIASKAPDASLSLADWLQGVSSTGLVVLIGSYQPGSEFQAWFEKTFVPSIKSATTFHVCVVIADLEELVERLYPFADLVIELGPLDRTSVGNYLAESVRFVRPPLDARELQRYIDSACEKPWLLGTLTRLLSLANVSSAARSTQELSTEA